MLLAGVVCLIRRGDTDRISPQCAQGETKGLLLKHNFFLGKFISVLFNNPCAVLLWRVVGITIIKLVYLNVCLLCTLLFILL